MHPVTIQYCQCSNLRNAGTRVEQLLRYELWPATLDDTTTCCTMRVLDHFQLLTLQSKITAYDYYETLWKLTDRMGIRQRYVSYMITTGATLIDCATIGSAQTVPTYGP